MFKFKNKFENKSNNENLLSRDIYDLENEIKNLEDKKEIYLKNGELISNKKILDINSRISDLKYAIFFKRNIKSFNREGDE